MNIAISGASGYIGQHLTAFLTAIGYRVVALPRRLFREGMIGELVHELSHCDVVINLAGAPINKRWTLEYQQEIINSRVQLTHRLVHALDTLRQPPKLFISTSAVGYYADNIVSDEYTNTRGRGFLADLCYAWEKEARLCPSRTRLVITRFGLVLSPDGGVMQQLLRPIQKARLAVGFGPGTQPFPWIDMNDLCRAMAFIIENESVQGVVNLVSPQEITQHAFVRALGKAHKVLATVLIPVRFIRMLMGESSTMLTSGQYVRPTRILEAGFRFITPTVEDLFEENELRQTDQAN